MTGAQLVKQTNHVEEHFGIGLDHGVGADSADSELVLAPVEFLEGGCLSQLGDWGSWRLA